MSSIFFNKDNIQIASNDELLQARLFGKDISVVSEGYILEAYQFNYNVYILGYYKYTENENNL